MQTSHIICLQLLQNSVAFHVPRCQRRPSSPPSFYFWLISDLFEKYVPCPKAAPAFVPLRRQSTFSRQMASTVFLLGVPCYSKVSTVGLPVCSMNCFLLMNLWKRYGFWISRNFRRISTICRYCSHNVAVRPVMVSFFSFTLLLSRTNTSDQHTSSTENVQDIALSYKTVFEVKSLVMVSVSKSSVS